MVQFIRVEVLFEFRSEIQDGRSAVGSEFALSPVEILEYLFYLQTSIFSFFTYIMVVSVYLIVASGINAMLIESVVFSHFLSFFCELSIFAACRTGSGQISTHCNCNE